MPSDDLTTARVIADRGGIAPPGLLRRLADRVEELTAVLRELEWAGFECPICDGRHLDGHAPGCRLARALGHKPTEVSDG